MGSVGSGHTVLIILDWVGLGPNFSTFQLIGWVGSDHTLLTVGPIWLGPNFSTCIGFGQSADVLGWIGSYNLNYIGLGRVGSKFLHFSAHGLGWIGSHKMDP